MKKVLFVCHGNICRSIMAECIFEYLVNKNNLNDYLVDSRATSYEEIGNSIYPKAKAKLIEKGVPVKDHKSKRITIDDYYNFDYILVMDNNNKRNILNVIGEDKDNKIKLLLDYTYISDKEIEDPWYTDNFEKVYDLILSGCLSLLDYIEGR